jgi:hypothetical protein
MTCIQDFLLSQRQLKRKQSLPKEIRTCKTQTFTRTCNKTTNSSLAEVVENKVPFRFMVLWLVIEYVFPGTSASMKTSPPRPSLWPGRSKRFHRNILLLGRINPPPPPSTAGRPPASFKINFDIAIHEDFSTQAAICRVSSKSFMFALAWAPL